MLHKQTLVTPCVNLNGTDKAELVRQQMDVVKALDAAIQAMVEATPYGRDYAFSHITGERLDARARSAVHDRLETLSSMREEFKRLALAIQRQER